MDSVAAIKLRLPIEQLVGSYCQLQKKGRNFVCLCPFHNDSHPSFLVSPDKGIGYCFACQSGGDIFSFYQRIEGVDFPQALKELAERAGVVLEDRPMAGPKKDEKDRVRDCLAAAQIFYKAQLGLSARAQEYLQKRSVPAEQIELFGIGVAPDSFSVTYEHLLKAGFSRKEIMGAGLGVQRELQEERIYDRFRNRLMFPIHDAQGMLVGFGGRTLGDDDAKYVNSSEGILFHKSGILYGLHHAKEPIREKGKVVLVEGYFDVLACHRAGCTNAVATCGTALTEQHVKLLRRYAPTATLCLDQDRAGRAAMERAFPLLSQGGMHVEAIVLPGKDPSDILQADPEGLKTLLESAAVPYLDVVLDEFRSMDLSAPAIKRQSLERLLALLSALPFAVERGDYLRKAAAAFSTTESALEQDLSAMQSKSAPPRSIAAPAPSAKKMEEFSAAEIALGIFLSYPKLRHLLPELIAPPEGMAAALYQALKVAPDVNTLTIDELSLPDEVRERVAILHLYCEEHGFANWSENLAVREIRRNCLSANKEMLRHKQQEITKRMLLARSEGKTDDEAGLRNEYEEVLKLMRKSA